jgi:hypothetical protein
MTPELIVIRNIALIPVVFGVLQFLFVTLCREWVKSDLLERFCHPISVRWRPFASTRISWAFTVIYSDFHGQIHRANCRIYWHRRNVIWLDDEIIVYTNDRLK